MPGKFPAAVAAVLLTGVAIADPILDRETVRGLVDAGKWHEVIANLAPAVERNPYRGEDWHVLGIAHARLGDCATAAPLLERGIELGVNSRTWGMQDAHVEAAQCAASLGDPGLAIDHLSIAQARYKFSDFERFTAEPRYAELVRQSAYRRLAGLGDWANVERVDGWNADLNYFVDLMERRHPDPFHTADEREWRQAVSELRELIPSLTDLEVVGRFMKLAGAIRDGHTSVYPPFEGPLAFHMTPIWPYAFGDDWRIIAAAPEFEGLIGDRIVAVEGVPIDEATRRIAAHLPADNEITYRWTINLALQFAELSQAIFGAGDSCCLTLDLEAETGEVTTVRLAGGEMDRNPMAAWAPGHWPVAQAAESPLWLRNVETIMWYEELEEFDAIYAQLNQIRNADDKSVEEFGRELRERLTAGNASRLILDLRHNNGGNGYLNWPLVRELVRTEALEEPDSLFVITGRRTFSAAMLLASMLEFHTDAIFVGEPTGSRPQFYGEDTLFVLPYSKLAGSISSRWFQNRFISDDERPWIAPDIVAELTYEDLTAGRDPALSSIRDYLRSR